MIDYYQNKQFSYSVFTPRTKNESGMCPDWYVTFDKEGAEDEKEYSQEIAIIIEELFPVSELYELETPDFGMEDTDVTYIVKKLKENGFVQDNTEVNAELFYTLAI